MQISEPGGYGCSKDGCKGRRMAFSGNKDGGEKGDAPERLSVVLYRIC